MSIKIDKKAYEKQISEDLDFLNKHCPDSLELDHIKLILCNSIDYHYPKSKIRCLKDKAKICNQCHECDINVLNPNY